MFNSNTCVLGTVLCVDNSKYFWKFKWFNEENPRAVVAIKNFNLTAKHISPREITPTKHPRNTYETHIVACSVFQLIVFSHVRCGTYITAYLLPGTCLCNFLFVYKKQLNIGCLKWDDLFTVTMYYIPVKPCTAAPPMNMTGHMANMWKLKRILHCRVVSKKCWKLIHF